MVAEQIYTLFEFRFVDYLNHLKSSFWNFSTHFIQMSTSSISYFVTHQLLQTHRRGKTPVLHWEI